MDNVVHIVDERLGAEGGYALSAFWSAGGGRVVGMGALPRWVALPSATVMPAYRVVMERLRRPVRRDGTVTAVHCWSMTALRQASDLAWQNGCPLTVHLPSSGAAAGLDLSWQAGLLADEDIPLHVTVPLVPTEKWLIAQGLPADAVTVLPPVPLPAPPDWQDPRARHEHRRRVRKTLGVADATRLIVAPDEMIRAAGLKYAVWAHAILRHITPDVRLFIPTVGPGRETVLHYAAAGGFPDEMLLPRADLPLTDALAAADMVAFVREDDLGLAVPATAVAMNLPIVATATPDTQAFLGSYATIVPPKDPRQMTMALLRLLNL